MISLAFDGNTGPFYKKLDSVKRTKWENNRNYSVV